MASNADGAHHRRIPWRLIGWAIPIALLMIPWLAHFPWTAADFIVAGAIFAIVGGSFELAVRASGHRSYRAGAAVALGTAFLLVWIDLAVGIIGNENNPLNLMFFAVIAAAIVGSVAARFQAKGMARAMTVAAALQGLIGVAVLINGWGASEPPALIGVVILILFFAATWLLSAFCFRKAAVASSKVL
jgi:hypothetical protein